MPKTPVKSKGSPHWSPQMALKVLMGSGAGAAAAEVAPQQLQAPRKPCFQDALEPERQLLHVCLTPSGTSAALVRAPSIACCQSWLFYHTANYLPECPSLILRATVHTELLSRAYYQPDLCWAPPRGECIPAQPYF